ncbi:MAG: hypothetical protein EZS28_053272 [Streblomastix strix]|uniref:Uncharacterized protein n=1 Tax=Streblomastix strix TaxID=222440 RepID=A0A5J4RG12_9EUKA|nr:MAG: hypothetical protein EZS28_053272 [Streblomastix strix]
MINTTPTAQRQQIPNQLTPQSGFIPLIPTSVQYQASPQMISPNNPFNTQQAQQSGNSMQSGPPEPLFMSPNHPTSQ